MSPWKATVLLRWPLRAGLCAGMALLAGLATSTSLAQPPGGRYNVVEYAVLDSPGTVSVVRHINNRNEAAAGFKGQDRRKMSQAFILAPGGPLDITAGINTDNAVAYGLNDAGEVAGAFNTNSALRPFRSVRRSSFRELSLLPQDTGGAAYAINENGEAVGYSTGGNGARAVSWTRAGVIQALPTPAGTTSRALDINPRGDVVGVVEEQPSRAALWPGKGAFVKGALVRLDPLQGFLGSEAVSINERGDVVGFSVGVAGALDRNRAVLWRAGSIVPIDLGTLLGGGTFSRARDVNVRGEVVGVSTSDEGEHAFIWTEAGGMVDLNSLVSRPDLVLVDAVSINRNGVILALAEDAQGGGADHGDHEVPRRIVVLITAP